VDTIEAFLGDDVQDGEWIHFTEDLENPEEVPDYM
jgi:hypothetical protein